MLFNSYSFIFMFLPLVLGGFFLLGHLASRRIALTWLMLGSLVFYGAWRPVYLWLLAFSMGFNFSVGLVVGGRGIRSRGGRKILLAFGIAVNLGLLGYFKYADFFVDQVNGLFHLSIPLGPVVLPLAISFFTFQQIAYLVDAYRGFAREYHFVDYCLFVSFFPQLIAGPIVHHTDMMPQFQASHGRFDPGSFACGISYFVIGLFKKVVIADNLARFATPVFAAAGGGGDPTLFEAWGGALAYTGQIYYDFSGYSDMAIGLGLLIGIRIPVNFNSPYQATGIADFWRRWHMTLSQFLRDYLYIPLGGNRKGPRRRYLNLMITMLLGGLWHGAGWTFVLWGGLHGIYLVLNSLWQSVRARCTSRSPHRFERGLGRLLTLVAVTVGWVYFRAESTPTAHAMLGGMVGAHGVSMSDQVQPLLGFLSGLGVRFTGTGAFASEGLPWIVLSLAAAVWLPNSQCYLGRDGFRAPGRMAWRPTLPHAAFLSVLATASLLRLKEVSEFLYFQF